MFRKWLGLNYLVESIDSSDTEDTLGNVLRGCLIELNKKIPSLHRPTSKVDTRVIRNLRNRVSRKFLYLNKPLMSFNIKVYYSWVTKRVTVKVIATGVSNAPKHNNAIISQQITLTFNQAYDFKNIKNEPLKYLNFTPNE